MSIGPVYYDWTKSAEYPKMLILLRDVLGWEVFRSAVAYQEKYEKPPNSGHWQVTPTNVALSTFVWPAQWKVFSPDHEILYLNFDPLHDRDHAGVIMQHIYDGRGVRLIHFVSALLQKPVEAIDGELPWLYWMDITMQQWMPEQLCHAAYEAVRMEHLATQ